MKVTKERLSYLKQAQYVQRLAEPYIRKGKLPLWKIHGSSDISSDRL